MLPSFSKTLPATAQACPQENLIRPTSSHPNSSFSQPNPRRVCQHKAHVWRITSRMPRKSRIFSAISATLSASAVLTSRIGLQRRRAHYWICKSSFLIPVSAPAADSGSTPLLLSSLGKARSTIKWEWNSLVTRSLLRRLRTPTNILPALALAGRSKVRTPKDVSEEQVLTERQRKSQNPEKRLESMTPTLASLHVLLFRSHLSDCSNHGTSNLGP
jgi:hypothetical protein